jgi:membrane associated rhomboid family serine protease
MKRVWRGDALLATKIIIGINIAAFVAIGIADRRWDGLGHASANYALAGPEVRNGQWYRLFTYSIVHFGFVHIFFNLLILWMVGRVLEPGAGHLRFALLYVVSVLGGAAGALVFSPHAATGGASGGVFGVATAATIVLYRQGVRFWDTGFGPLLLINLIAVPLVVENVSIGGHIGGMIAGGLATEAMVQARKAGQPVLGWIVAAFVGVGAFLICLAVAAGT